MTKVGAPEIVTQKRVIKLFKDILGYNYLGDWKDRQNNSNIEEELLRNWLTKKGYSETLINKALHKLNITANNAQDDLYTLNKKVYGLLRFGINVNEAVGQNFETVELVDWKNPNNNDFSIAEEVTFHGQREKRPDLVLYINGIALGVIELKRSTVSIGEGIRQSRVNQQEGVISSFFSTIQFVFAASDSEGLLYGTIKTEEKYFLKWKEGNTDEGMLQIDKYLIKICDKSRFLELIYDFVLFDGGIKKLPRPHQYFSIKAAQKSVSKRKGGIIWHTQGSGKSIVMVLLAKWILENNPNARVLIITDRDELDTQIERVFNDVDVEIKKTNSGKDLMSLLGQAKPRLICSLVHKFGNRNVENFDDFIKELENNPSNILGEVFVFVDECHRTQSGKLHKVMKTILKDAIFIGFTGTPLLKKDKQITSEVFGGYIHTYKFNEAIEDGIVLDLMYEARDIDQRISSQEEIDEYFNEKTKSLSDYQKAELKKKWGTMQNLLSSTSRIKRIVSNITSDFDLKEPLKRSGNAILVAGSIYEACRYFEEFGRKKFKGKCAIITSYNPSFKDIVTEDSEDNSETHKEFIYNTYIDLLEGKTSENYEKNAKEKFLKEPANMKLLIVVDKLLTGFDAPHCTYLYIDKNMRDHTLFQAICRVNRLDGEKKKFGYIVDYKNLFENVNGAINVYTSPLDDENFKKEEIEIVLKDRLEKAKERLDNSLEELELLCEPVEPPKETLQYFRYFCGNIENTDDLKSNEFKRHTLYKNTVSFIRAYANISLEMEKAGYSENEIKYIKKRIDLYCDLRDQIKIASHEAIDLKSYEADMRYLIDEYIEADRPKNISQFDDLSLLEIIIKSGMTEAIKALPESIKNNKALVDEVIANNIRSKIMKDHLIDPAFYDEMSKLLTAIIKERKDNATKYEDYLKKMSELAKKVQEGKFDNIPVTVKTQAQRALYNNLGNDETLALGCDKAVKNTKKADWKGNKQKENEIKASLYKVLNNGEEVERIFDIVKEQPEYYNLNG